MAAGQLERQPAGPLADVLLGALTQAGMVVARADDPPAARAAEGAALARVIEGLGPAPRTREPPLDGRAGA